MDASAYLDHFARDHLPPPNLWPMIERTGLSTPNYPKRINAAAELLDRAVENGWGNLPCLHTLSHTWTYAELLEKANRIASVLVDELGVMPGERVLLRDFNSAMLAACWFATLKAGAIAVATMPLLKSRELASYIKKAKIRYALCAQELSSELEAARQIAPEVERIILFRTEDGSGLEARMKGRSDNFVNVIPSHDDVAIIAFTSGTTNAAKATMHFHRDLLTVCDCFPPQFLKATEQDVFCGTPPLAFTFGLGGLLLFPMRVGASSLLLTKASPEGLLAAIEQCQATICFTAPTAYRTMIEHAARFDISSLRKCVSAGEALPASVFDGWKRATKLNIIDGLGTTEMLHIFISATDAEMRAGALGKAVPGYEAIVVDDAGRPSPASAIGYLAVRGATGCRYLGSPEDQTKYVRNGWNLTGDACSLEVDGYFKYHGRVDDLIVSSGYKIAGIEVEAVLLTCAEVRECAVVGCPDDERGQRVTAFIVLADGIQESELLRERLERHIKSQLALYKCPREIRFVKSLPRTETGKVQRSRLRSMGFAEAQSA